VKTVGRVVVFVLGLSLLLFAWRRSHKDLVAASQGPANSSSANSSAVLVVIGGFLALMAFLPSSETLSRWSSRKRPKPALATRYRRRRKN
jgi:hypothetical protein